MKKDVKNCLIDFSVDGDIASSTFVFPSLFRGFEGHFSGSPILPGICLVQAVVVVAEKICGGELKVNVITEGKFLAPVAPCESVVVSCKLHEGDAIASIKSAGNLVAKIKVKVTHA